MKEHRYFTDPEMNESWKRMIETIHNSPHKKEMLRKLKEAINA